jgi:hypothetical protein
MKSKVGSFIKRTWKWLLLFTLIFLIIDFKPIITQQGLVEGAQARTARAKAKVLADKLASADSKINIEFNANDVNAISSTLSHMFDNTQMGLGYSPNMVQGASSTQINAGLFSIYINVFCEISLLGEESDISHCSLGDLPIPGAIVDAFLYSGLTLIFDREVANTIDNVVSNISVKNSVLSVNASKSIDFKERINDTLNDASSLAKLAIQTNIPDSKIIQAYLEDIDRQEKTTDMSVYIKNSMQLAAVRSIDNDPVVENKAAIWAWAISFGTQRFARIAGITEYPRNHQVMLRGRRDLAQHFIYSAIIAQLSSTEFSANAGELKEILDSSKGGSGFSFADLLADNTGIAFANVLTKNRQSATQSQSLLAAMTRKDTFFPYTHDLPEGLSQAKFKLIFNDRSSDTYTAFVNKVNARIAQLPLYSDSSEASIAALPKVKTTQVNDGIWLSIDTHIHSRYSDGVKTIEEIARQAKNFGCDVIAITDHGDQNLSGVLSDNYFDDIDKANIDNVGLTVMPGLEWNVPPFNGREHATVLLPQHPEIKRQLRQFRTSFDHYQAFTRRHLTIEPGLSWLNKIARDSSVSPVVIYNHPSRKDDDSIENKHDIGEWQAISATVIGMSGSPGHQKKRGHENGSYETKLKTTHGLDPIAGAGGEWDLLLQKGYRVLSARAPSDFHNTNMDYWPCQFSTTHVFSKSRKQDDVLQSLINGRTWAQHGRFVEQLNFRAIANGKTYYAGQSIPVSQLSKFRVNIDIELAKTDWQGFKSDLDNLSLVIVTDNTITSIDLLQYAKVRAQSVSIDHAMTLPRNTRAIRLLGRSIQAEMHHYPVFTNPILVEQ